MALVTVFDKEGVKFEMESVDARECVNEMGWTFDDPAQPVKEEQPKKGK